MLPRPPLPPALPQGRELAMLEPNSLTNHDLAVSADGRFVAVASFTAEVKIWELKWAKETGDFKGGWAEKGEGAPRDI